MQKLYGYVDETGQDTQGGHFFVAVVIVSSDEREELRTLLKNIEEQSNKRMAKWHKADWQRRRAYMKAILDSRRFHRKLFFSHYTDTREYLDHLITASAQAILRVATPPYRVTVQVDGLGKIERRSVGQGLRALRVHVEKVRGLRDESDAFIRLADAIAGLVRDGFEKNPAIQPLYQSALRSGLIQQLP